MSDDEKPKVGDSETPNPDSEKNEVEDWLRTVQKTEKWRKDLGKKKGWDRYVQEYKNDWNFLQSSTSIPIMPVNMVYSYAKTEVARLYFKDPWITCNAKRQEELNSAKIAEQILNYTWMELDLKRQIKMTLLEAILVGHSYVKVGYSAEFGTVESQPEENEGPRGPGRPKKKREVETSEFIKSENVFAYHVPHKDIIFDPSATYPWTNNARWMAHKIVKPIRAIKESGIYENTDDLKTSGYSEDPNFKDEHSKDPLGKDVRSATLWEIYDLDNMQVVTVSPGCPKYLSRIEYPKWLNGAFPISMLAFNPIPGEVFPMSDIAPQEGLILEITKIVAMWLNHLKRFNRQIFIETDMMTPDEKAKYKDSIDGAIIEMQTGGKDKMFIPQYAPVQSDSYQIYQECMKLYFMVSGQTGPDQGGQAKTNTRTLGELRMQLQGGHARADEKVDVLEDFIGEIAKKLLAIMQKQYDLVKIARIVGPKSVQKNIIAPLQQRPSAQPQNPQGQPNPQAPQAQTSDFSFTWNKEDILGDMDVDVVAGSTVPMDKESQLQILEKLIPLLPAAGVTPGSPAAKAYARELFRLVGIQSVESVMDLADQQPPQPNPKMAEIQAKVQAKQQESQVKIQGKKQEEAIKLEAMKQKLLFDQQKLAHQHQKNQMDIKQNIIKSLLEANRAATEPAPQQGVPNGNVPQ